MQQEMLSNIYCLVVDIPFDIVLYMHIAMARPEDQFQTRTNISEENGPGGPVLLEYWPPGPIFSPDQNFRDITIRDKQCCRGS